MKKIIIIKSTGVLVTLYGLCNLALFLYPPFYWGNLLKYIIHLILTISWIIGGVFLFKLKKWAKILCITSMGFLAIYMLPMLIKDIKTFPANVSFIIAMIVILWLLFIKFENKT